MTRTFTIFAVVAAAALAGCNKQETAEADNAANATVNAVPVEMPPTIAHSGIYRCKDNSVVYVDWLSDNKSANFRADRNATPIQLKADEGGKPMTGEGGYSLTGTAQASSITLARPGKASQSCKA